MDWTTYCFSKAEECDAHAKESDDPRLAAVWRRTAADWRDAGAANDNDRAPLPLEMS
jgi:hypothetical protein